MADFVPVTEESLRAAMRDPRYWRSGHPEREEYNRWVTEGWRAVVNEGQGKGGVVQVRAYTRTRNGKTEQVGAHTRADPPGGDDDKAPSARTPKDAGGDADVIQVAAAPAIVQGAIRLAPQIGRVLPRGLPALRRRNLLDDAIDEARRGSIAPRSWYNTIPEQPGEREAASEADAEATSTPRPETTPSTPEGAEPDRPRYTVHPGQQGKHQPGHNNHKPERGRSEMAPDVNAQELVDRFSHRGESANGISPGTPGSLERFDAGDQIIGVYRDSAGRSAPTTRGIIHYGSNGSVHVRPAAPRGWTGGSGK